MESIIDFIINIFDGLASLKYGKELLVFLISLMPILELRGGLLAASLLGLSPIPSYIISIIGNLLPIPFILLFINKILKWMSTCKIKWINKVSRYLYKKADKNKSTIEKYGYLGLVIFVGLPLPGTGAWTGTLIASLLNMDRKKSFICITIGVVIASILMMILSFGILRNIIS